MFIINNVMELHFGELSIPDTFWLDSAYAVPLIGIRLQPGVTKILDWQRPVALYIDEQLKSEQTINFALEKGQLFFHLLKSGFLVSITGSNLVIRYNPEKDSFRYSDELRKMWDVLTSLLEEIEDSGEPFVFNRVGLVAQIEVNEDNIPPPVIELQERLTGNWKHPVIRTEAKLTVKYFDTEDETVQCHHTLIRSEEAPIIKAVWDWQVIFKKEQILRNDPTVLTNSINRGIKFLDGLGLRRLDELDD